MGVDVTAPLPTWADNDEARALLAAIVADPPEYRVTRGTLVEGGGVTRYLGKPAAQLRRMHTDWLDAGLAKMDAAFAVDPALWDQAAANALFRTEDADQLIERMLQGEQLVDVEHIAPGRIAA